MATEIETEAGDDGETANERPTPAGLTRDQFHARERAAFLASSGATDDGDGAADGAAEEVDEQAETTKPGKRPAAKPAKPATKPAPVETDDDDDDADAEPAETVDDEDDDKDDDDDAGDRDVETDDDEDDAEEGDAAKDDDKDPELAKRMAAVRRTEQRQRQQLERDRASFDRDRAQWAAERTKLTEHRQRFDKLAERVKYDSYSVLRELGVSDDDMVLHAQHLYARSKDAAVKPEHRAAADRALREREVADKASKAETEVEKLRRELAERDERAAIDRDMDAYFDRAIRKVTDEAPHTKTLVAKSPRRAREALAETALELFKKNGERPGVKALIAAHEKKEQRWRLARGIDAPAATGKSANGKKPAAEAAKPDGKKKPANGANGRPRIPTRAEMLAELEEFDKARPDN